MREKHLNKALKEGWDLAMRISVGRADQEKPVQRALGGLLCSMF